MLGRKSVFTGILFAVRFGFGTLICASETPINTKTEVSLPPHYENGASLRSAKVIRHHNFSVVPKKKAETPGKAPAGRDPMEFSVSKSVRRSPVRRIVITRQPISRENQKFQNAEQLQNLGNGNFSESLSSLSMGVIPETENFLGNNAVCFASYNANFYIQGLKRERLKQNFGLCMQFCVDLLNTMERVKRRPSPEYRSVVRTKTLKLSRCIREIASQIIEDDGAILQTLVGTVEYTVFRNFLEAELLPALLAFRDMGLNKTYDDLEYLFDMFGFHDLVVRFRRALSIISPRQLKRAPRYAVN